MAKQKNQVKLTARNVAKLAQEMTPGADVWDTDISGFHVRAGKRGLTFRLYYCTQAGKRRTLTLGSYGILTATQARQDATEALGIVVHGGDPRANIEEAQAEAKRQQEQTLHAYLEGPYTAVQNRRKDGAGTLRRIRKDFPEWLDKPMSTLSRADVEKWQAVQESVEKPRAFGTLKRSYDALHALLTHAASRDVILSNPLAGIKLQRPAPSEEELSKLASQRRYLDPAEVEALFAGLEAYQQEKREQRRSSRLHGKAYLPEFDSLHYVDHVVPWVLIMYYTGFRPGDITGLRWEHVIWHSGKASIRKTIEKTAHHHPHPMSFPLSSVAAEILSRWHQQQGRPPTGLAFPSPRTGQRLDSTAMQKPWARIRQLAGLPNDLVLYSLRHNFASQLIMNGADLLSVSKLMAHSDIQTTIEHYAHLSPNHSRDFVEDFAQQVPNHMGAP
ncbi:MAG: site-specific integrase [Halomonas subglaciescola]|nr:site-specific integrase [Halomonas subglaciescola]